MHNTLVAAGPDFKSHFVDELPTGNADVAPTIRHLLGFPTDHLDGRVLGEALQPVETQTLRAAHDLDGTHWQQYLTISRVGNRVYYDAKATAAPAPRHTPLASLSSQGELGCTER
jgi:hypothetical protein